MHHQLDAAQLEFHEGQQTLWIHSPDGYTLLRIKCTGKILVDNSCSSPTSHCDIIVQGDINICIPKDDPGGT
jgi:hypothetical protein